MKEFMLVYIFLIVSTGIFITAVIFNIYFRTKVRHILAYLFFFSVFTASMLFWLFRVYLDVTGVSPAESFLYKLFLYLECIVSPPLLSFLMVVFLVDFFSVKNSRRIVLVAGALAGTALLQFHLYFFFTPLDWESILDMPFIAFAAGFFITVIVTLFSIVIIIRNFKSLYDIRKKKISIFLGVILFALSVFSLVDFFFSGISPVPVYPVVYCIFGIAFGVYIHRHYAALPDLADLLNRIAGDHSLSERETEILEMLVKGMSYKELTQKLYISMNTVKTHVKNIYGKLNVNSRSEIVPKLLKL